MADTFLKQASYISQALAVEAGDQLREMWKSARVTGRKDSRDVATQFDEAVERNIVEVLHARYPSHGFILEEEASISGKGEFTWVIDPIDGTKYFAAEIPLFTVSIGLLRGKTPVLGTIYNPISSEVYWGYQGLDGIYVDFQKIDRNSLLTNNHPIASIGVAGINNLEAARERELVREMYLKLSNRFERVRVLGQGSLSLAWLCRGAFDIFFDLTGQEKLVDIVAGLAILRGFGGYYDYLRCRDGQKRILATRSTEFFQEIRKELA